MKTLIVSTILAFAAMTPIAEAGEIWRASGFEQPESALFDAANKRIIVSNIAGNPGEADGNGYLSVLSLDGKLVARHWTDGMDAPEGMALSGGKL
ncbi:MAG: ATP/GTP-binding protein, partial [Mesorhizobium sp.]